MKFSPSTVRPDAALSEFLTGKVLVKDTEVSVYSDWQQPTTKVPDVFLTVYQNGSPETISHGVDYASGELCISLYCKLNSDGTVNITKVNRVLAQFDTLVDRKVVGGFYFEYDVQRFITPTTPNQATGYSITTLNMSWHTTNDFNS